MGAQFPIARPFSVVARLDRNAARGGLKDRVRLASAFDSAMEELYRRAKSEAGYPTHAGEQLREYRSIPASERPD